MVMSTQHKKYLPIEESSPEERIDKSGFDFLNGELITTSGSRNRNLIIANLTREISQQLKDMPCELYPKDMQVRIPVTHSYTYPDIVVICGNPKFESNYERGLLNPLLIIQVISKANESYYRNERFSGYRTIETFAEYLLVAENRYEIEQYVKQPDGQWLFLTMSSPKDALELFTLRCTLTLEEIYDRVQLLS